MQLLSESLSQQHDTFSWADLDALPLSKDSVYTALSFLLHIGYPAALRRVFTSVCYYQPSVPLNLDASEATLTTKSRHVNQSCPRCVTENTAHVSLTI